MPFGSFRHRPFYLFQVVAAIFVPIIIVALSYARYHWQDQRARDIEHTTEQIQRLRIEDNIAECKQTNQLIDGVRHALVGGADGLLAISTQFTPEQIRTIHDTYRAAVEAELPFRDCSSAGITFFLNHPPPDPGAK